MGVETSQDQDSSLENSKSEQGCTAQPRLKTRGTNVWVPTPAIAPHARPKAGLGVGCGRGLWQLNWFGWKCLHLQHYEHKFRQPFTDRKNTIHSRCEGPGYHPRKFFENSDTKSCILVTTCCEISCFLKTTAKKLGTNTLLVPQPKRWGTSLPGPLLRL